MSMLKVLVVGAVVVGLLMLIPVFFIFMASDMNENITVDGQYSGIWSFMNTMNVLIAMALGNLGYVLAIMVGIGMILAAIGYVSIRGIFG